MHKVLIIMVCLCNIIAFGMYDYSYRANSSFEGNTTANMFHKDMRYYVALILEITCESIFILELALELFSKPLFKGIHAFFKSPWSVANLVSIAAS